MQRSSATSEQLHSRWCQGARCQTAQGSLLGGRKPRPSWIRCPTSFNPVARSSPAYRGAFEGAPNVVVAEEQAFGALGSDDAVKSLKQLLRASRSGRPCLSKRTGVATPAYPHPPYRVYPDSVTLIRPSSSLCR